jgi:Ca-activated chloride channel family protein
MGRLVILTLVLVSSISTFSQLVHGQDRQPPVLQGGRNPSATPPPVSLPAGFEQQVAEDDVVRVDSNLVTVPASIMDRDGRYITDLRKTDFQILEDGVEQEIAYFAPVEQPFTILFLLDLSGSMSDRLTELENAASVFLGQLRGDDRLSAVAFAETSWVLVRFTKVSELSKGIRLRLRSDQSSTMIYDAVNDALERIKKSPGRRAIVVFSDGFGSGLLSSAKDNLRKAEEGEALIYTVQFDTLPDDTRRKANPKKYLKEVEKGNRYMRDLALKTGGQRYQIESLSDLGRTFGLIADQLRRQYSLGYYPKNQLEAGQQRQIKVKVRIPHLIVRARDGYLVDKDRAKRK